MGLFDTRSFATGLASGLKSSLDEASKKRQEAEAARQDFLQKLQLEVLRQIPEIEKNVFAGKSDPASGAAMLQQLQTRGAGLAPVVPPGNMIESLINLFAGAPGQTTPQSTDLSGLEELLGRAQSAGATSRATEQAAKTQTAVEADIRRGNTAAQKMERAKTMAGIGAANAANQALLADVLARQREAEKEAQKDAQKEPESQPQPASDTEESPAAAVKAGKKGSKAK